MQPAQNTAGACPEKFPAVDGRGNGLPGSAPPGLLARTGTDVPSAAWADGRCSPSCRARRPSSSPPRAPGDTKSHCLEIETGAGGCLEAERSWLPYLPSPRQPNRDGAPGRAQGESRVGEAPPLGDMASLLRRASLVVTAAPSPEESSTCHAGGSCLERRRSRLGALQKTEEESVSQPPDAGPEVPPGSQRRSPPSLARRLGFMHAALLANERRGQTP
ncbi:UNVERIFIED_CONTAM: hypothetical protein K2H54_027440 [Gekko kuhli]